MKDFESHLRDLARVVMSDISSESAPPSVETALRAEFRAHVAGNLSPVATNDQMWRSFVRNWFSPRWRLAATAASIIVLISVLVGLWAQSRSGFEKPVTQASVVVNDKRDQQSDVSGDKREQQGDVSAEPSDKILVRRHPARHKKRYVREVVTEFYPLMESADLDSLEVFQMVRVELPGSALRAAGLPVAPELLNEPVTADVMLGYDGLARAIRFVR
ncbi:MAG TPA: hypothetical protein VJM12_05160 [Pyrinomonadaceae bacterium]|nr:hypothetical protein [Pyrinomonadaceae bacterium]